MTRTLRIVMMCMLSVGGLAGMAHADDACAPDREQLCKGSRGPRAMGACMKEHEANLSDACKAQRATVSQAKEEVHADCQADVARLCASATPGHGHIRACIMSHRAELSPACTQAIANVKALKEAIHPGCRPDAEKLCQGIAPGGGRIIACLKSHEAELSPTCKAHVDRRAASGGATAAPAGK